NPLLGDLRIHKCADDTPASTNTFNPHGAVEYWSLFQPICVKDKMAESLGRAKGMRSYLSEDWAFSARAVAAKVGLWIYERPTLVHHGLRGYTLADSV